MIFPGFKWDLAEKLTIGVGISSTRNNPDLLTYVRSAKEERGNAWAQIRQPLICLTPESGVGVGVSVGVAALRGRGGTPGRRFVNRHSSIINRQW